MWYDADKPNTLSKTLMRISKKSIPQVMQEGIGFRDKYAQRFSSEEQIGSLKD